MRRIGTSNLLLFAVLTAHAAVLTPEQALKVRRISEVTFSVDGFTLRALSRRLPKVPNT